LLPPGIAQFFLPPPASTSPTAIRYEPSLFASASVRFVDAKREIDHTRAVTRLVPFGSGAVACDWNASEAAPVPVSGLQTAPIAPAEFGDLPPAAVKGASYLTWSKEFQRWLQDAQPLTLLFDDATETLSKPDETEAAFRARIQLAQREQRDAATQELRKKYAAEIARKNAAIARAQTAVEREQGQRSAQMMQTAVSVGSTLLGALLGRKTLSVTNLGRATTAARGIGRTMKEEDDVKRAAGALQQAQADLADINAQLESDIAALETNAPAPGRALSTITIKATPSRIAVERVTLVWVPR
jgi:hypothetical protein